MIENVTQIKFGITMNVHLSSKIRKNIKRAKKIIFGILVDVL